MAKRNSLPLSSMSPASDFGSARETLHIKQEEDSDSENSNMNSATADVGFGIGDEITVKTEPNFSFQTCPGSGRSISFDNVFPGPDSREESLSQDFDFIRCCLASVLEVDSKKRHELVQAIKSKLKRIEVLTTRSSITKAIAVKSELTNDGRSSSMAKRLVTKSKSVVHPQSLTGPKLGEDSDPGISGNLGGSSPKSEGLVSYIGHETVKCNVCGRINRSGTKACVACASYVCRVRLKCRAYGRLPPSCYHVNFSGGSKCKSCRFHKYVHLCRAQRLLTQDIWEHEVLPTPEKGRAKKETKSQKRIVKFGTVHECIICEKKTLTLKGWRCSGCYYFQMRLIARYKAGRELPVCDHDGSYAGLGCKGCRRMRIQKESALRDPELASKLPTFCDILWR